MDFRRTRFRWLPPFAVGLLFAAWSIAAERPPRDPAAIRAERRQMAAALAAQLGNPRFETREEATKAIAQLGIDAVEPLLAAAGGENLEVTCRALRALATIYESNDDDAFDTAEAALERLAESTNRSAAQRAAEVLSPPDALGTQGHDSRRTRRWKRAIARIQAQGGIVKLRERPDGAVQNADWDVEKGLPVFVMLSDEWKGGNSGLVNIKRMAAALPPALYARLPPLYVIDGTDVSPEALAQLTLSSPPIEVEFRGRARLGVECLKIDQICRVSGIEKNSAAEKAGIRPNDVIQKYDGETLVDFGHLARKTRGHNVGDKVELEVLRDGEIVKIEAELTGWASSKALEVKK